MLLFRGWTLYLQCERGLKGHVVGHTIILTRNLRQSRCLQRLHRIVRPGEQPYPFSSQTSPTSPAIDAEAFSSGSLSLPQSPKSEIATGSRSRAATILNKVVPAKLRASLKRRMSGANDGANHPPVLPSINTMPTYSSITAPDTPPDDVFGRCFVRPPTSSATAADNFSPHSSPETILPPTMLFSASPRSPTTEPESYLGSPLQSPRTAGMPSFTKMDALPETSYFASPNELVSSPLHPPTISPLMSPMLSSTSQTSLNASGASVHTHKKAPSIDPATSSAPQKPVAPLTLVTANSLADMIEEMQSELAAYDATLVRMKGSGWSSPQEIRNVELQREQHQRTWEERITESKKILQGIRRSEMKDSAMSSVSSLDSFGSMSGSVQLAPSHVTSAPRPRIDTYSFAGPERTI
ncbi:hypothetical protein K440DRAFT_28701 [Wilcoxina mikolae CBS 423.85]|nr:hypothetical protein K440DRAFT_28701 [Wilcoxina mikolae CBS 423.85]